MRRAWLASLITIIMLLTLPGASIIPKTIIAHADDVYGQAQVTGQVTVQATQPTVSFTFYSDSSYQTQTTKFTPQTPVYMKISVSGDNPLEEATITVQLFADNDNTRVGTPPSTTSPETYVTFTISYDSTNGQWVLQADTGGSTSWSIQLDPNQNQPDPTSNSGDFYVVVTFGKTAREANTGDQAPYADWDVIVTATIGSGDLAATSTASVYGYTVYFYGEITASANTISFGTLKAGESSQIQQVDGNAADHFTVTVIANGYYDLLATSSATWSDNNGHSITLVTSNPGNGQFSLQIDDQLDTNGNLAQPVYVTTDPTTASPFVDNAQPTTESGASSNVYMLITLGHNIYTGTYQGTITIHVVDGE